MRLKPLGSNQTELTLNDGTQILFSYETPVAAHRPGVGFWRTAEKFSVTTSRHITKWLGGARAQVVSQEEIEAMAGAKGARLRKGELGVPLPQPEWARFRRNPSWKSRTRELSVPEKHQLRIARQTLTMSPEGVRIMGGPSIEEAKEIIARLTGRHVKENPPGAKIGGYPTAHGDVIDGRGKDTGWFIAETVEDYRPSGALSWMARTAHAVILRRRGRTHPGRRVAVAFSYGTGMILRGEEIDPELTDGEIRDAARGEAEYWLNVDTEDAERDEAEQMREEGRDDEEPE